MDDLDFTDALVQRLCGELSPIQWIKTHLGKTIMPPNQTAIVDAIFDDNVMKAISMQARQCVVGDTNVLAYFNDSLVETTILDVINGHMDVLAMNTALGTTHRAKITSAYKGGKQPVFTITTNERRILTCTDEHKLYSTVEDRFMSIKDGIRPGHKIAVVCPSILESGTHPRVLCPSCTNEFRGKMYVDTISSITAAGVRDVYDLTVDQWHNYVTDLMLVHNSGKTEAYACGILAHAQLSKYPGSYCIFGPKEGQAFLIMDRITAMCNSNKERLIKPVADYKRRDPVGTGLLKFNDGTTIRAISAAQSSSIEGFSASFACLDESHRIDTQVISEKILPMLGGTAGRIFYNSVYAPVTHIDDALDDPNTHKMIYDWTECPWLLSNAQGEKILGRTFVLLPLNDGLIVERSAAVLQRMPRIIKQELYPHNPIIQYMGRSTSVWDFGSGDMDPEAFKAHYLMVRTKVNDMFLSKAEYDNLAGGTHDIMLEGSNHDIFYAGVDFAGASTDYADYTEISISRRRIGNVEKVHNVELYGLEYEQQYDIIQKLCHPHTGKFRCRLVCVDTTGVGLPTISSLRKRGIEVAGVVFSHAHKERLGGSMVSSGKNMKNAMFEHMKIFGCGNGQFKYPNLSVPILNDAHRDQIRGMSRGLEQWKRLQVRIHGGGANKAIEAPRGFNDDVPCADALSMWAASGKATAYAGSLPLPRLVSKFA